MNISNFRNIFRSKIAIGIAIVLVIGIGSYFLFFNNDPKYQFVTVQRGTITETVSLTGNTVPKQNVSLAFGSSGIVSDTYSELGKKVRAGQVLAELNMRDLVAQLHNAQAALTIAEQQVSSSEDNVANVTAEQDAIVASAWQGVRTNLVAIPDDEFTLNAAPTISGSYTGTVDGSYTIKIYASHAPGGASFNYFGLESGNEPVTINADVPLGTRGLFIRFPNTGSISSYSNSVWTVNIPNTRWNGYANALKNYQTALETRNKAIANAQASVGTVGVSSVADAQIVQAKAGVDSALARIANAQITAPISGTVTQFDAKVGQLATMGTPLISIISDGGYEVEAGVSEIDIGKVLVGDTVSMTLDSFPNETFTGSVFYLAPSETNNQGVVSYLVKISFDKADPRLKSGLTANVDIKTRHKDDALILPQYAILQNDEGNFVETLEGDMVKQNPVMLGIVDQKGNVEVLSGVTEGEQVLNIGLRVQ